MTIAFEPDVADPAPPTGGGGGDDDEPGGSPWWHAPSRLVALAIALVFLGAAAGYAVTARGDRVPGAGSVDVGFLQDMRLHHDNAVAMAFQYLQKPVADQDPGLRIVAGEILLGQQLEN